jgi:hypothetical protein
VTNPILTGNVLYTRLLPLSISGLFPVVGHCPEHSATEIRHRSRGTACRSASRRELPCREPHPQLHQAIGEHNFVKLRLNPFHEKVIQQNQSRMEISAISWPMEGFGGRQQLGMVSIEVATINGFSRFF